MSNYASFNDYEPKLFGLSGRIGRVRYAIYSMTHMMVFLLFSLTLLKLIGDAAMMLIMAGMLAFAIYSWILVARRLHDIGVTAWWSVPIMVFPILFFALVILKGTDGDNEYGTVPPEHSPALKMSMFFVPVFAVLFMVAAHFQYKTMQTKLSIQKMKQEQATAEQQAQLREMQEKLAKQRAAAMQEEASQANTPQMAQPAEAAPVEAAAAY